MIVELPFFDAANFNYSISLDQEIFLFRFQYNTRGDFYSLNIFDENENAIYLGLRLVSSIPLFLRWRSENDPKGELFVLCPQQSCSEDPKRNGFIRSQKPFELIYVETESL